MDGCVIYLIRPGSTSNDEQQYPLLLGRQHDPRLSAKGLTQVEQVGASLRERNLAAIYTSPAARALTTARIVGAGLVIRICLRAGLAAADTGEWAGKPWKRIRNDSAIDYGRFLTDPGRYGYPGGETFEQIQSRIYKTVLDCAERHLNQQIVIVSHADAIKTFLAKVTGLPLYRARDIDQDAGCVNVLRYMAGEFMLGATNQPFFTDELLPA